MKLLPYSIRIDFARRRWGGLISVVLLSLAASTLLLSDAARKRSSTAILQSAAKQSEEEAQRGALTEPSAARRAMTTALSFDWNPAFEALEQWATVNEVRVVSWRASASSGDVEVRVAAPSLAKILEPLGRFEGGVQLEIRDVRMRNSAPDFPVEATLARSAAASR